MLIKSLFWQIINSIVKICLEIFVFDRKIRRILKGNWAKFYLRKYVVKGTSFSPHPSPVLDSLGEHNISMTTNPSGFESHLHVISSDGLTPYQKSALLKGEGMTKTVQSLQEISPHPNPPPIKGGNEACDVQKDEPQIIWQYWESKDGSVPPLVQACLNSVDKFKGNRKRIILNPDNVKDYVNIPEIFWQMREKGLIKTAFFSDILRTCLLIQHGGIWMDATVLLTEEMPQYITDADLFVFQNDLKIDLDGLNMASYFIVAKQNNPILVQTLKAMEAYWKENRFLVNYFTFLHAFTMITLRNKEIFSKVPFFSFLPVQQMQGELLNTFDNSRWEQLKKISGVHKLTHKQSVLTKKKEIKIEGTFFEHILEEFK